jgi:hypothetical protein
MIMKLQSIRCPSRSKCGIVGLGYASVIWPQPRPRTPAWYPQTCGSTSVTRNALPVPALISPSRFSARIDARQRNARPRPWFPPLCTSAYREGRPLPDLDCSRNHRRNLPIRDSGIVLVQLPKYPFIMSSDHFPESEYWRMAAEQVTGLPATPVADIRVAGTYAGAVKWEGIVREFSTPNGAVYVWTYRRGETPYDSDFAAVEKDDDVRSAQDAVNVFILSQEESTSNTTHPIIYNPEPGPDFWKPEE